jgi:hypothetical protein
MEVVRDLKSIVLIVAMANEAIGRMIAIQTRIGIQWASFCVFNSVFYKNML